MACEAKELSFGVYQKKDQKLKHVHSSSNHRPTTVTSITMGVGKRFARLTLRLISIGDKRSNQVYPDHAGVLKNAGLTPEEFPTLGKIWEEDDKAHAAEKTS
eukprot:7237636-Ditylum_brightwellii.AAC.1